MVFALLFLLLVGASAVQAQPQFAERAAAQIAPFVASDEFSGVVRVQRGEELLYEAAFGEGLTPQATFRLASVTKPFTAVAVLRLVALGELALDVPACNYVEGCPDAWAEVTIAQLLSHTGGIPSFTNLPDYGSFRMLPATPASSLDRVRTLPLEFAPGAQFAYSNSGYVLLGEVLESVRQQPYETVVRDLIATPLGLEVLTLVDAPTLAPGTQLGTSGVTPSGFTHPTVAHAAGGLMSTAADVAAFFRGALQPGFLPDSLRDRMLTPILQNYALGWVAMPVGPGRVLYAHSGGIDGFSTFAAYDPEQDLTLVVLANREGNAAGDLAMRLHRVASGNDVPPAVRRAAEPVDGLRLSDFAGVYRVAPMFALTITVEGGSMMLQGTGQPAFPMFHAGNERFFLRVVPAEVQFTRDGSGRVTGLTLFQGGQEIPALREGE